MPFQISGRTRKFSEPATCFPAGLDSPWSRFQSARRAGRRRTGLLIHMGLALQYPDSLYLLGKDDGAVVAQYALLVQTGLQVEHCFADGVTLPSERKARAPDGQASMQSMVAHQWHGFFPGDRTGVISALPAAGSRRSVTSCGQASVQQLQRSHRVINSSSRRAPGGRKLGDVC